MTDVPSEWVIDPMLFALLFPLAWVGVAALMAHMAGWAKLAQQFRTIQPPIGQVFRFASGAMGASKWFPVNYNNCLFLAVGPPGIRISLFFLFRVFAPPLLIPWRAIDSVVQERRWMVQYTVIRIRGFENRILVRGKPGEKIAEAWARYAGQGACPSRSGA